MSLGNLATQPDQVKTHTRTSQSSVIGKQLTVPRIFVDQVISIEVQGDVVAADAITTETLEVTGEASLGELNVGTITGDSLVVTDLTATNAAITNGIVTNLTSMSAVLGTATVSGLLTVDSIKVANQWTYCPGGSVTAGHVLVAMDTMGNLEYAPLTGGGTVCSSGPPVILNSLPRWDDTGAVCLNGSNIILESDATNLYIGQDAILPGSAFNVILGTTATVPGDSDNVSVGYNNNFSGAVVGRRIMVGNNNTAVGNDSLVLGHNSTANGTSIALGNSSTAVGNSVVIGHSQTSTAAGDIILNTGNSPQQLYVPNLTNASTADILYYNSVTGQISRAAIGALSGPFVELDNDLNVGFDATVTGTRNVNLVLGPATTRPPAGVTGALISGGVGGENTITDAVADNSAIIGGLNNTLVGPGCAIIGSSNVTIGSTIATNSVVVARTSVTNVGGSNNFVAGGNENIPGAVQVFASGNTILSSGTSGTVNVTGTNNLVKLANHNGAISAISGNDIIALGDGIDTALPASGSVLLGSNITGQAPNCFAWGDGTANLNLTTPRSFTVRATGGVRFEGNTDIELPNVTGAANVGYVLTNTGSGTGTWQAVPADGVDPGTIDTLAVYTSSVAPGNVGSTNGSQVSSALTVASSGSSFKIGTGAIIAVGGTDNTVVGNAAGSTITGGGEFQNTLVGSNTNVNNANTFAATIVGANASGNTTTVVVGSGASCSADASVVVGRLSSCTGVNSVVVGQNSSTASNVTIVVGDASSIGAGSQDSILIGRSATIGAASPNTTLIGNGAQAGVGSTVVGTNAVGTGANSIVLGTAVSAGAFGSCIAIGSNIQSGNSLRIGIGGTSIGADSIAIGHGSVVNTGTDNIVIGHNASTGAVNNTITIGNSATSNALGDIVLDTGALPAGSDRLVLSNVLGAGNPGFVLTQDALGKGIWQASAQGPFAVAANDNIIWNTSSTPNTSNLVLGPASTPPVAGVQGVLITGGVGGENTITNPGSDNCAIISGTNNTITAGNNSLVGGVMATTALSNTFVWGDGTAAAAAPATQTFTVRASNGLYHYSNTGAHINSIQVGGLTYTTGAASTPTGGTGSDTAGRVTLTTNTASTADTLTVQYALAYSNPPAVIITVEAGGAAVGDGPTNVRLVPTTDANQFVVAYTTPASSANFVIHYHVIGI